MVIRVKRHFYNSNKKIQRKRMIMKKTARIAASIVFILTFAVLRATTYPDETHTVETGKTITFIASAESATPVTFEWYKNDKPLGVTGTQYVIKSATADDMGTYSVIATNPYGSTGSNKLTIKLVVLPPKEADDTYKVIGLLEALRRDLALATLPKCLRHTSGTNGGRV
jgi:hypothetical protein